MPYYFGEDMDEWWDYMDKVEADPTYEAPQSPFKYIEPWEAKATVLPFAETPGPEPELAQRAAYRQPLGSQPGFFARLFGRQEAPAQEARRLSPEQILENYRNEQKAACAHVLWKVSRLTGPCRALGVKRVFGSYDGGGDESFTYFNGIEMSDGRAISAELLRGEAGGIDCERLVEDAAFALMGRFDAGNFQLHGVVIIDFDTCRITDERDADVVFGHKMPWEV
ncbi:MAG TPA: hypothetical protein VKC66_16370 [Xanthobacteraceae bacterium]|nr:hypothetical protein [Xanthobacteraceae bacterium]